jgi:TP901 family phage tail tape measure protein
MPDYDLGTARGRIEIDASSLGRASAAFTTMGRTMLGMGALAVGGFVYVAKAAADFEKILSGVKAVTGATAEQMDALREKALTLGSQSIFSADQIAGAFEDLGKAGISVDEILGGAADAVIHLAHAAGDELPGGIEQGAEIIANAMKTFEVGADQAEHFADVLVAAAASSTVSVDDLATSLRYAGPIAHEMGLSIDDLSTTLAILGDRGIKGSTAGTSLRGVLLSLSGTSVAARKELKELGIITEDGANKFFDMNGSLKPIPEVMQILQDATSGLSEEQKISAFNTIFQRRAMNAALIMAEQGAAGFEGYADAIGKLNASDIAATKLDNLSGDMTILKNSVHSLIIRVGEPLQAMLRGWVQNLTDIVHWFGELDPVLLANIVKWVGFAGAILMVLGAASLFISMGFRMYKTFVDLFGAIKLMGEAFGKLGMAMLTNPWVLLAAAIIALGIAFYLLYQNSEGFREWVDGVAETIMNVVTPAFNTLKDGVLAMIEAFKGEGITSSGFVGFMERIGVIARDVYLFIVNDFIPGFQAFWDAITGESSGSAQGFIGVMENIGEALRIAGEWCAWLVSEGIERLVSGFEWFQENVWPIVEAFAELVGAAIIFVIGVIDALMPFIQIMVDGFKIAFNIIVAVVQFGVRTIMTIWNAFAGNFWEAIQIAWALIKSIIEVTLGVIRGIITTVTGLLTGDWAKAWDGIKQIFAAVWEFIKVLPGIALDALKNTIQAALDFIRAIWDIAWDLVRSTIQVAWDTIKDVVVSGVNFIVSFIQGIPGMLSAFTGHLFDGIINAASSAVSAVYNFFLGLPGMLISLGGSFLSAGATIIGNLISGLLSFAGNVGGTIASFARDLGNGVVDWINSHVIDNINSFLEFSIEAPFPPHPTFDVDPPNIPHLPHFHEGGLFRTSGREGLAMLRDKEFILTPEQLKTLSSAVQSMSSIVGTAAAIGTGLPAGGVRGGDGASLGDTFVFNFPNVRSGEDADKLKQTLMDPSVLSNLVNAVKVGRR